MTATLRSLPLYATLMYAGAATAFDYVPIDDGVRDCYGKAMIGYDTVINARLGLPPEHALALARHSREVAPGQPQYRDDTLIVMWGAYLWDGSPHNYALAVFYRCAREHEYPAAAALQ